MPPVDTQETDRTRQRYNRIAGIYDLMETLPEFVYQRWRQRVWKTVEGKKVIEVGVGTGKNMPFYPADSRVTGIDISEQMLAKARRRAEQLVSSVELLEMDAQQLEFDADTFDSGVATFVFCSVPDPVEGLKELQRVVKSGGEIILLEHMRSKNPILAKIMDWLDPLVVRAIGPHINRYTDENVKKAGLEIEYIDELDRLGIFRFIAARSP
ncbi:MAG: class I SAM-dependent methyltransferase [Anaerolineae bacterium]